MKKIVSILLALHLVSMVALPVFAEQYAYVKTPTSDGTVYVRKVAGAGQPIAGVARNGDTLLILKKGNTWHRVRVVRTGLEGYMYGVYIKFISDGSGLEAWKQISCPRMSRSLNAACRARISAVKPVASLHLLP